MFRAKVVCFLVLVALINVQSPPLFAQVQVPSSGYGYVVWHPQGQRVVMSNRGVIDIYTSELDLIHRFSISEGNALDFAMSWSPNGRYLAAAITIPSTSTTVRLETLYLWDAVNYVQIDTIPGITGSSEIVWKPDSTIIASAYRQEDRIYRNIGIYRISDGQQIGSISYDPWYYLIWSQKNKLIAANTEISIWDALTHQKLGILAASIDSERPFVVNSSGNQMALISLNDPSNIEIWDLSTLQRIRILDGSSSVYDLDWGINGLITASSDGARIWNPQTGTVKFFPSKRIQVIRWRPDGSQFIGINADDSLSLRDANTGAVIKTLSPNSPITIINPTPTPSSAMPSHADTATITPTPTP